MNPQPVESPRQMFTFIAATYEEDVGRPCFLFCGSSTTLIKQIFRRLVGSRDLISEGAVINTRSVIRQGKPSEEVSVELIRPNTQYYPLGLMRELITILIEGATPAKVTWMPIDEFININNTKLWNV